MRQIRIYQPGDYVSTDVIPLSPEASHHVRTVLRMQLGQPLVLFPGDNREFAAVIVKIANKTVFVEIGQARYVSRESPLAIHLAQAISKGDRMEMVIQKAVELGVKSITPLITGRAVVKLNQERMERKLAQWQAIVSAACEQSGRNQLPQVNPILQLSEYLQQPLTPLKFVLHPNAQKTWRHYPHQATELTVLIGPEGGFSEEEISRIFTRNFEPLALGPRVLRTETAAMTSLSVLQAVWGDL